MIGTVLGGRYTIIEEIGKGGMANVFKAKCNVLNRIVAVKVLRTDLEGGDEFINRFNTEAQAAACLAHPNIVSIYDVGEENGMYYIVMEYIEGITLKEYIKNNVKLSSLESAEIASQICDALSCAHEKNIIHRDIKPHNILVAAGNFDKVTDFGIARASNNETMQVGDSILGSVQYISPEQARGGYVDCRSDIYSLGIVIYEMLTGKLPFESESPIAIAMKHLDEIPVPPKTLSPDIVDEVQDIVLKAISKETRKRYQTVAAMKSDLDVIINMLKATTDEMAVAKEEDNEMNDDSNMKIAEDIPNDVVEEVVESEAIEVPVEDTPVAVEEESVVQEEKIDNNLEAESEVVSLDDESEKSDDLFEDDNDEDEYYDEEYDDDEYEERRGISFGMVLSAILISLIVVGGATLVIGAYVFPDAHFYEVIKALSGDTDVDVPTFVGKQLEEAKDLAKKYGLEIDVVGREYGPQEEGIVIEQSIAGGNSVKSGTVINLETSKGPDPDLFRSKEFVDKDESVIEQYEAKGYNIVRKYKTDETKKEGTILDVEMKNSKIIFYICGEDDSDNVKVPDLTGLTVNQARAELEKAGLLLLEESQYSTKESATVKEGRVVGQSKSAGAKVKSKTQVKIYLAVKPKAEDKVEPAEPETKEEITEPDSSAVKEEKKEDKKEESKEEKEPKKTTEVEDSASKVTKKTITLDMSDFETTTQVKIVDPSGNAVYDKAVDPSTTSEINIPLEGKGKVTYVVYINGVELCKYPVSFSK